MTPITIDVGIGDILQAISSIIVRAESERETAWDSLAHQLEAVSLTVGRVRQQQALAPLEPQQVCIPVLGARPGCRVPPSERRAIHAESGSYRVSAEAACETVHKAFPRKRQPAAPT